MCFGLIFHKHCSMPLLLQSLSSRPQLIETTVGPLILGHVHQVCLTVLHVCLKAGTVRSQTKWAGDVQPSFLLTGLSEPLTLLPKLRLHSASQPQIWLQQSFQRTISDKREVRRGWRGGISPWFSSTSLETASMWDPPVPLYLL